MADLNGQADYAVRFDWGLTGALAVGAEVTVIVDVLSFSTSVTIAVERGIAVLPYRWRDRSAADFARKQRAVLAVGRLEGSKVGSRLPSLSPASLLTCDVVERLVLPSPNGSTIAHELSAGSKVIVGCFLNASAVGAWLADVVRDGRSVAVIAAGERWAQDNSLRPALEDLLGGGAILGALAARTGDAEFSPEAKVAAASFGAITDLTQRMATCVSGRELSTRGFSSDVAAASAVDSSATVPILHDGAFRSVT